MDSKFCKCGDLKIINMNEMSEPITQCSGCGEIEKYHLGVVENIKVANNKTLYTNYIRAIKHGDNTFPKEKKICSECKYEYSCYFKKHDDLKKIYVCCKCFKISI